MWILERARLTRRPRGSADTFSARPDALSKIITMFGYDFTIA